MRTTEKIFKKTLLLCMYSGINDVDGAPIFLDISTKKYTIMNLDVQMSKFRLDRTKYRKELLVLDQEKSNGQRIKNLKQRPAQINSVCLIIKVCMEFRFLFL